jgi:multisubunit Na+/H+ antiporter MnhG subunit
LLIAAAVWLANPTATHALGRAALRAGFSPRLHGEEPR